MAAARDNGWTVANDRPDWVEFRRQSQPDRPLGGERFCVCVYFTNSQGTRVEYACHGVGTPGEHDLPGATGGVITHLQTYGAKS